MKKLPIKVLTGRSNATLAKKIVQHLNMSITPITFKEFSDGEYLTAIQESIRNTACFVLQSTNRPVTEHFMELYQIIETLRGSSSGDITVVMPYMGYSRQDRKSASRTPITAKMVAKQITNFGVAGFLTIDLHADQIQGFFDIPVDHLTAQHIFARYFHNHNNLLVVSPDVGGTKRAEKMAELLSTDMAFIYKRRDQNISNKIVDMKLAGDVAGKNIVIVDDIADTLGTLKRASELLKTHGANDIYACITHAVLSGNAINNLEESPIKELVITDTIEIPPHAKKSPKIKIISVAKLFAEAIRRRHTGDSLTELFNEKWYHNYPLE